MNTFESMGIEAPILTSLESLGFEHPTPVQSEVIPFILSDSRDLIALARTGTGKTAAFGIPMLQLLDHGHREVQALVVSPTRELCMQIAADLSDLGAGYGNLDVLPVYGGAAMGPQISRLRRKPGIVVATPGRLLDFLRRDLLDTSAVGVLVLDEADEMLRLGFREDLEAIMATLPGERRTLLFSATMPQEIRAIAGTYLEDPYEISMLEQGTTPGTIRHGYFMVRESDRYHALARVASSEPGMYGIVFCRTKEETRDVAERLAADGFATGALHGDLSQAQRDTVMAGFRSRSIHLMAATDVAARGIDVADLTHVIHYRLPDADEGYIHRSGRTGRVGKTGVSLVIAGAGDGYRLRRLERRLQTRFERMKVPSPSEIVAARVKATVDALLEEPSSRESVEALLPLAMEALQGLSHRELVTRILMREIGPLVEAPTADLHIPTVEEKQGRFREGQERSKRPGRAGGRKGRTPRGKGSWTKLVISAGARDGMTTKGLFHLINTGGNARKVPVGVVRIMARKTLFEIPSASAGSMISELAGRSFGGKSIRAFPE